MGCERRPHALGEGRYLAPGHFTPGFFLKTVVAVAEVTAVLLAVRLLLLKRDGPLLGILPLVQEVLDLLPLALELLLKLL